MAKLYPELENIQRLKVQPTEGEYHLIDYFIKNLDDDYEVFFNPFLDGDRPDFIILKKGVAIFIIEVKDYHLENYRVDEFNKWSVKTTKNSSRIASPQSQAFNYKKNLYQLHLPIVGEKWLGNRNFFNLVNPFVYLHCASKDEISNFYTQAESIIKTQEYAIHKNFKDGKIQPNDYNYKLDKLKRQRDRLGRDKRMAFGADSLGQLINRIKNFKTHVLFDDEVYNDFKRRLMPSEHVKKQGKIITLDDKQKLLSTSSNNKEKIKGVAGCGKTLIIANRAVNAFQRHNEVTLILTYNITLKNLIKDRISDVLGRRDNNNFVVTNYHQFFNGQVNDVGLDIKELVELHELEHLYETDVFQNEKVEKYHTILIDEIQDFKSEWVKIIRDNFLIDNGEMVLFGDYSQNIYKRENQRSPVVAQGFGRWQELKKIHRISQDSSLNDLFKDFQSAYLSSDDNRLIDSEYNHYGFSFGLLKYHRLDEIWYSQANELINQHIKNEKLQPNDVVILSSKIFSVRNLSEEFAKKEKIQIMYENYKELEQLLIPYKNYMTTCQKEKVSKLTEITEEDLNGIIRQFPKLKLDIERARRTKKNHFYANSGLVKFSTTHSYKGLESKTVFFILDDEDTPEIVYTSITRTTENLIILDKSKESPFSEFFSSHLS